MNDADSKRVQVFLSKWLGSEGNERANYQTFFGDFCVALGVEGPAPKGSAVGGAGARRARDGKFFDRCIFTMFAEDVELLKGEVFTKALRDR